MVTLKYTLCYAEGLLQLDNSKVKADIIVMFFRVFIGNGEFTPEPAEAKPSDSVVLIPLNLMALDPPIKTIGRI